MSYNHLKLCLQNLFIYLFEVHSSIFSSISSQKFVIRILWYFTFKLHSYFPSSRIWCSGLNQRLIINAGWVVHKLQITNHICLKCLIMIYLAMNFVWVKKYKWKCLSFRFRFRTCSYIFIQSSLFKGGKFSQKMVTTNQLYWSR